MPARADACGYDRAFAMAAVVAAHVVFAFMLMQPQGPSSARRDRALEVVFIQWLPPPVIDHDSVEPSRAVKTNPATPKSTGIVMEVVKHTAPEPASTAAVHEAPTPIPMTQADDRWDVLPRPRPSPDDEFHRNPLERPPPDLTALPTPTRFRMRKERAPEDVVKGIAQFVGLWPPGYTTDPCPALRRSVSSLSQERDAASRRQLEIELDRERRHCR